MYLRLTNSREGVTPSSMRSSDFFLLNDYRLNWIYSVLLTIWYNKRKQQNHDGLAFTVYSHLLQNCWMIVEETRSEEVNCNGLGSSSKQKILFKNEHCENSNCCFPFKWSRQNNSLLFAFRDWLLNLRTWRNWMVFMQCEVFPLHWSGTSEVTVQALKSLVICKSHPDEAVAFWCLHSLPFSYSR